ncbi:MAG: membrane protein insertion efficiency factor YidD [Thermodesulfobacteriota bacterium]|nr:membrane protein insertion efficiency factor YidD [Thermodesulfobacteriota bacterium]
MSIDALTKGLFFPLVALLVIYSSCTACERGADGSTCAASQNEVSGLNPGAFLVSIYRDYLSSLDGQECPSIPSCSAYSVAAFKKHGFFIGWVMTVDRLIHEGRDEGEVSPVIYHHGKRKVLDPLENNDFWWFHGNSEHYE